MPNQPLILVPGLLCDEALWAPQVASLADVADIAIADTRSDDSIAGMAERLLADAPERFALCGLSMGGYVSFEVMCIAPERVTRLALLDTAAGADTPERTAARRELVTLAGRGEDGFEQVIEHHLPGFIHPARLLNTELCDTIRASAQNVGAETYARQQEAIIGRRDQRPNLGAISCPTLVLCGRQDNLTPLALHEEIAAGIPNASLEVVEDCGHLSTLECPEDVNRALASWLEREQ